MNTYKLFFLAIISLLLAPGCKAPIQLSNITIVEHFKQNFNFENLPGDRVGFLAKMLATADIASKFNYYVEGGKGNITKKALHNDSIGTDGVVIFTLSLIPFKKKPTRFDVSGIGHYDIIHKRSHEVFFTSTFRFTECMNCDPIENLIKKINEKDTTSLKLKFTQVAINQFDYYTAADIEADGLKGIKYSHVPAEPIEVHINLKMRDEYGSKCFSINYDFKHPVRFQGIPIGTLSITPPKDIGSRIIDLKNMNLLIRKYKKAP